MSSEFIDILSNCSVFRDLENNEELKSYVTSQLNETKRCMMIQKRQSVHIKSATTTTTIITATQQSMLLLSESIQALHRMMSNHIHSTTEVCQRCPSLYFMMEVLSCLGEESNKTLQERLVLDFLDTNKTDMIPLMEDYISDIEQVFLQCIYVLSIVHLSI